MPFDHEKLRVYQAALRFIEWLHPILPAIPKTTAIHSQLDRASTSIALNIAEGNGRRTSTDRVRFFDIACGSVRECAAGLDIAHRKGCLSDEQVLHGKQTLEQMLRQLLALMKSHGLNYHDELTGTRLREDSEQWEFQTEEKEVAV
ncbi:MAG TPA: four helix bundle protein [Verrucomicrobiales bacterium]|nr:four helix bundle protein [Verrucomicrobiales bacterium]